MVLKPVTDKRAHVVVAVLHRPCVVVADPHVCAIVGDDLLEEGESMSIQNMI